MKSGFQLGSRRNHQRLADFDLVGILQVVGFDDDGILVGVAVEMPADFGQIVPGLYGIALVALLNLDVVLQVGKVWIDRFDCIPDAILARLRNRRGFEVKLVAIQIQVLQLCAWTAIIPLLPAPIKYTREMTLPFKLLMDIFKPR